MGKKVNIYTRTASANNLRERQLPLKAWLNKDHGSVSTVSRIIDYVDSDAEKVHIMNVHLSTGAFYNGH